MPRKYIEVGATYGGGFIGKGISRLYKEVDKRLGRDALPVSQRIKTWADLGTGIALGVLSVFYGDRMGPAFHLAVGAGTVLTSNAADAAEEAIAGKLGESVSYEMESAGAPAGAGMPQVVEVKRVH